MKELGIYIHIPFCKKKCDYCDFISFDNKENYKDRYLKALLNEILNESSREFWVDTIYIGGGTPSYIDEDYIEDIIKQIKSNYNIIENPEITIEINPGVTTKEKLKRYKDIGINRLSIGLQSTNDTLLKNIGRIHTFNEFLDTYNLAKEIGFKNINVDLMLGLPNQTIDNIEDTIKNIIKLDPNHISTYSLILEENTKLYNKVKEGKVKLIDDEFERKMYWLVKNELEKNNYIHYEISNFAKKGYESKHNLNCWDQKEYLGFGLSAHSYINNKRYSNTTNIEKYINDYKKYQNINEIQTKEEKQKEYMLLGLRKIEGVNIQEFKNKFIDNPIFLYKDELNKLVNEELLEVDLNNIKLTSKGLNFANLVWKEFV